MDHELPPSRVHFSYILSRLSGNIPALEQLFTVLCSAPGCLLEAGKEVVFNPEDDGFEHQLDLRMVSSLGLKPPAHEAHTIFQLVGFSFRLPTYMVWNIYVNIYILLLQACVDPKTKDELHMVEMEGQDSEGQKIKAVLVSLKPSSLPSVSKRELIFPFVSTSLQTRERGKWLQQ